MAREGITRAQVFDAADKISAAGQSPTVASIRAQLGTGSFTTITTLLREWKNQATEPDTELDVPEEVTQALGRAAELVWKAAQDHFKHELSTLQADAARKTAAADQRATEAEAEIARLEAEAEKQAELIETLTTKAESLTEKLVAHDKKAGQLSAELRAAQSQIKEQSDLLKRLIPAKTEEKPAAKKAAAKPVKPNAEELAGQA